MRGRYLSLQLTVDGCESTLPSAKQAQFPRNVNGVPSSGNDSPSGRRIPSGSRPRLTVKDNKLEVIRVPESDSDPQPRWLPHGPAPSCDAMRLVSPVDFYIAEHANDPTWLKPGQEFWIEVTVPPKGPPRPLQLALKDNGAWKPLAFQ